MDRLTVTTLAERPELVGALWDMPDSWPDFLLQDPLNSACLGRVPEVFGDHVLVATDDDEHGAVVGRAFSVPFRLADPKHDGELPARGWDAMLLRAFADHGHGEAPDTVGALEVSVRPDRQGHGLSGLLLAALRENARGRGFAELVAPVRPVLKHLEPWTPMSEYAVRTRAEDGLPSDPWLRVHVRAGAVVEKVAPASMTVSGSLAEWRAWTGLPFERSGEVVVPGALTPVRCDREQGVAVYVEPNVWVRHRL
ncbi:N-acetyltransferase [Kitasatospora sp. NPDC089797]|uniref:N-acetyltransferase n=1 Tax=Kitasatospora sp. NPDC089797 TaxID=3155298 RepID=UPI0034223613